MCLCVRRERAREREIEIERGRKRERQRLYVSDRKQSELQENHCVVVYVGSEERQRYQDDMWMCGCLAESNKRQM